MTPERWGEVKAIFGGAVEKDTAARADFVREHCGKDEDLLREVELMLDFDCKAGSVLDSPVAEAAAMAAATPAQTLPVLGDRYEIQRELGRGGMSVVYLARDHQLLDKSVVVKILLDESSRDPWIRQKFMQEIEALARIDHPGVVGVLDTGLTAEGRRFLVMQFIEGVTLRNALGPGAMDFVRTAGIVRQTGHALAAAHEKGVWHRDLKPDNIMVEATGGEDRIRLIDFGIAAIQNSRFAGENTKVSGSASYMAPEQFTGHSCAASDTYALGLVAYRMLTGTLPRPAPEGANSLTPNLEFPAEVPAAARAAIIRALSFRPDLRQPRVVEFSEQLYRALTGGAGVTAGPALPRKSWRSRALLAAVMLLAAASGWSFARGRPAVGRAPAEESIAVLPFRDMSAEKDQAYFAEGLAEELRNELARSPGLRVAAGRSSSMFGKGADDIHNIGNKLHVANLLQGSVRKLGNRARISVQLVKSADGFELWSDTFDRELTDVLAVQQDIAVAVTGKLRVTLISGQTRPGSRVPIPEAGRIREGEAHNLYMEGRYFLQRRNRANLEKAVDYFEQASRISPGYAPAWVGLAEARSGQAGSGYIASDDAYRMARDAVDRALALDPARGDAYAALAWIQQFHDSNRAGAEESYRRALELEPGNAVVISHAAILYRIVGRLDQAIALGQRARDIDPLSPGAHHNAGVSLYYAGRHNEAKEAFQKALELVPDMEVAHSFLGRIHLILAEPREALAEMEQERNPALRLFGLALAYHALGRRADSDAKLEELIRLYPSAAGYQAAEVYAFRGESDKAFGALGLENDFSQLKGDPLLQNLTNDPRYAALLKKAGLPW